MAEQMPTGAPDDLSPTTMLRNYLQQNGMPLTAENMNRAIGAMNRGEISGLTGMDTVNTPPNLQAPAAVPRPVGRVAPPLPVMGSPELHQPRQDAPATTAQAQMGPAAELAGGNNPPPTLTQAPASPPTSYDGMGGGAVMGALAVPTVAGTGLAFRSLMNKADQAAANTSRVTAQGIANAVNGRGGSPVPTAPEMQTMTHPANTGALPPNKGVPSPEVAKNVETPHGNPSLPNSTDSGAPPANARGSEPPGPTGMAAWDAEAAPVAADYAAQQSRAAAFERARRSAAAQELVRQLSRRGY